MTTILIVDDSESNRLTLRSTIECEGYSIVEAEDGEAALAVLNGGRIDAVISDILMPRLDGYQLCRHIRSVSPLPNVPIIIHSPMDAEGQDIELALRLGADRVLSKPCSAVEIRQALRDVLTDPECKRDRNSRKSNPDELLEFKSEYSIRLIAKLEQNNIELMEAQKRLVRLTDELTHQTEELRESESRFRQLAENISEVFWIVDATTARSVYVSPACTTIWGIDGEVLTNGMESWINTVHPDDRHRIRKAIAERLETGVFDQEYRIIHADGTIRHIHDRGFPVYDDAGTIVRFVGLANDVTREKVHAAQLSESREQLRALAMKLQNAREAERQLIAREVHGELGQRLTALYMDLVWVRKKLPVSCSALAKKLTAMAELVDNTTESVQRISFEMTPSILNDLGLRSAIEWQANEFHSRTGICCKLDCPQAELSVAAAASLATFRILQETLTNVARHSCATEVTISLFQSQFDLQMTVRDNGVGIREAEMIDSRSLGLLGMRERAANLGGSIKFTGLPGAGTEILLVIPTVIGISND
ncbi:MAG: response regulator [Candidatus Sumerlaeaceae bacterium]|nr:response regulator [Candidatus Sumerlaeaceae bacterium]